MSSTKEHQKENPFHSKSSKKFDEPPLFTALPTFTTEAPTKSFDHLLSEESHTHNHSSEEATSKQSIEKCFKWCTKGANSRQSCKVFCLQKEMDSVSWNLLKGISLRYSDDDVQLQDSSPSSIPTSQPIINSKEYRIDFSNSVHFLKEHFKKVLNPGYELGCRYVESWKNGTQLAFFERLKENVKRGEALILAKVSVLKMIETLRSERK